MASKKVTAKRNQPVPSITTAVVRANAVNASRRVKQFDTTDGLVQYLNDVVMVSPVMPSSLVIDKSAEGAVKRREWCQMNGIVGIRVYDDGFSIRRATKKPKDGNAWRPEASMRQRLESLKGIDLSMFGYTRCETNATQLATVLALNWSKKITNYNGADMVYLYRIA